MKRLIVLSLILAPLWAQDKETMSSFRLKKEPLAPMRGYISRVTDQDFRFRPFGPGARKLTVKWEDLVVEDARTLRIEFGLEMTEDERRGLIVGQRIHFVGGGSDEGLLTRVDEEGRHWLKARGLTLPYPKDRVERVENIKLEESKVYDKNELYVRRLERTTPVNAQEHKDLADHMFDVGNYEKAREHYDEAIAMDSSFRSTLAVRMQELNELAEDEEFASVRGKAGVAANLNGDFDKAIALLDEYIQSNPDRKRSAMKALDEIRERRQTKMRARFHHVKHIHARYLVKRQIATGKLDSIDKATSWIKGDFADMLRERTRRTMGLSAEEYDQFMETKAKGAPHFAGYWTGSFIKQMGRLKTSGRGPKPDPDRWWRQYDTQTKANWLKAFMAEELSDIFEIVRIHHTDCQRCGGTGRVRKMSLTQTASGKHEWKELCPRCFGARQERHIAYR
jgi:tetratricopeptide (TPR) repeat protein